MNLKKLLIVLIIILILVISIFMVYVFLIKKDSVSESEMPPQVLTPSQSKEYSESALSIISEGPVLAPVIDNQRVKYYDEETGHAFESNLDGSNRKEISSTDLSNLIDVIWSPSKTKVISTINKNNKLEKYSYNYETGASNKLNGNIQDIAWAPNQDKMAYQYYNSISQENNISIADADGSNWGSILSIRMKDITVDWPKTELVAVETKGSGLAQSVVYTINRNTNNFEKIIPETYGLSTLWSFLGDKILYSETNLQGNNMQLKLLNLNDQTIKDLEIITLPEKCVWSQDNRTVFCAVPVEIPSDAVMPDDYWKGKITLEDEIWQINFESGQAKRIYTNKNYPFNASNLLLDPNENYLIFVNQNDNLLYSLEL